LTKLEPLKAMVDEHAFADSSKPPIERTGHVLLHPEKFIQLCLGGTSLKKQKPDRNSFGNLLLKLVIPGLADFCLENGILRWELRPKQHILEHMKLCEN
jgi:hypothetical protein